MATTKREDKEKPRAKIEQRWQQDHADKVIDPENLRNREQDRRKPEHADGLVGAYMAASVLAAGV